MIPAGTHAFSPPDGQLLLKVFREGMAARMGHDLVFEVRNWSAEVVVDPTELSRSTLEATAEISSFSILEATGGAKALGRGDKADIKRNIEEKILDAIRFPAISFRSTGAEVIDERQVRIAGELTIAATTRPAAMDLNLDGGRAKGTMTVIQSQWGIKPFSAMMGALKVRDTVEVTLEVPVPTGA